MLQPEPPRWWIFKMCEALGVRAKMLGLLEMDPGQQYSAMTS